jgi:hypothetical protein
MNRSRCAEKSLDERFTAGAAEAQTVSAASAMAMSRRIKTGMTAAFRELVSV